MLKALWLVLALVHSALVHSALVHSALGSADTGEALDQPLVNAPGPAAGSEMPTAQAEPLSQSVQASQACVILLHGLWRSPESMTDLQQRLQAAGYLVVNLGYPSRTDTVAVLAELAIPPALAQCPPQGGVSFVTHSLGGILLRQYLAAHRLARLERVVMLGPPNQGSEVVDRLGKVWGFEWLNGPAGMQLGTGRASVPNQLGAVDFELGVIAGSRSINWILSSLIPGPDDGKVAVEKTKVAGMEAHLVLPVNHATMMDNPLVIDNVLSYLRSGTFVSATAVNHPGEHTQTTHDTVSTSAVQMDD